MTDFDDWLIQTAEANRVIDYNSLAALQKAMVADGYMPYGSEEWATYEGQDYAVQGSRIPDSEPPARRVYYAPVGDWDNVQFVQQSGGDPPNGGGFQFTHWPTTYDLVTQRWGNNPEYYQQFGLPGHEGVDIRGLFGSPVMSVADGVVSFVHHDPGGHNYGRFVRVRHVEDYETTYAHLNSIIVGVGTAVNGGQVIGTANNTGNSFGNHLHLSLKRIGFVYVDRFGTWPYYLHDPTPFLEPLGGTWPPPVGGTMIDMLSFMKADPSAWRVVRHPDGSQEDFQSYDYGSGTWVMAKGSNGEWWRFDSQFIYLVEDTSPAPDSQGRARFYRVTPGMWCQRMQEVGVTFNDGGHVVQFYSKSTCEPLDENSGQASNNTTVLRLEDNYTFNTYGQNLTLDQVLFVQGNTEIQIFARHEGKALGRVGWQAEWGESEIVELYFDRPPLSQPPQRFCS